MKTEVIEYLENADLCGMTREKCATALGVHPGTLQAKLQAEDVDFRFLLLAVRMERVKDAGSLKEASKLAGIGIDAVCKLRRKMK